MPELEAGNFSLGTLLGLLIGIYLGHMLAIQRGKIQSRHLAALELNKTFSRCILEIENEENPTIIISPDVYHTQHKAAMDYSATLEGRKLKKFRSAVTSYTEWFKVVCNRNRAEIMYEANDPEYLKIKEQDPLLLIDNILKYAKT